MDTHIMLSATKWLVTTRLSGFVNTHTWVWPICQILHFFGMSLLLGAIGLFDLRLLGFAGSVPIAAMHRLVRWGILGFTINLLTGICFVAGTPQEWIFNTAFQFKVLFILLAGINILVFYTAVFEKVKRLEPGQDTPIISKLIGAASLTLWLAVLVCGRLLTFFRPLGAIHELF